MKKNQRHKTIQKFCLLHFKYGYDSNDNIYINNKEIKNFKFILVTKLEQKIWKTTKSGIIRIL